MAILLGIFGITGRMGKVVAQMALKDSNFKLISGSCSPSSFFANKDLGSFLNKENLGIIIEKDPGKVLEKAEIIIDFSLREALSTHLDLAISHKKPLVIGTTGFTISDLEVASQKIPLFYSPNFSLGMSLLTKFCKIAAQNFDSIDIVEAHHAQKKDSPSGSALALAQKIGKANIHSIRAAKIIGEHTVYFNSDQEQLEIKHHVQSRNAFAKGALMAAKFLISRPPKLYNMEDLLCAK